MVLVQPVDRNAYQSNAQKTLANMVDYAYQWVMEFNVSVLQVSPVDVVRLTSMNVLLNLATMEQHVLIYHKAIAVNVHQVILALIARKRDPTVEMTLAQNGLCARMNQVITITLVCVERVTQASIAT